MIRLLRCILRLTFTLMRPSKVSTASFLHTSAAFIPLSFYPVSILGLCCFVLHTRPASVCLMRFVHLRPEVYLPFFKIPPHNKHHWSSASGWCWQTLPPTVDFHHLNRCHAMSGTQKNPKAQYPSTRFRINC